MPSLVHIAVGGSSGWGKSVFVQSLAWQLLNAQEAPDLAAIDLEGVTLNVLANSDRLLYPLASTEQDAVGVLQGVTAEIERRKALFSQAGAGVASLDQYNAVTQGDHLKPVVLLVDEATALLENKNVEGALKTVCLRARKYGVWAILAGQDWKASSLDTAIRNQLSTRVQFRALSASQSRVLLGTGDAADLDAIGRAIAEIPGRGRVMLQAPMITAAMFASAARGAGPQRELPDYETATDSAGDVVLIEDDPDLPEARRIQHLHAQGCSKSEIERRVFGFNGGAAYRNVKAALER
jgi:DNA segregation ATPase FtsK/SpoIIIE-like protein